ncbi:unnamed protein product [Dovyalis caffra]|uniref:Integrase zinc-binding domain-containing protein n=1 Tax=Dovyalis caffra TaxID=77055 RepID=A0AAV1RZR8_9ROSI|nr:unnamed protein product [Dovyalis caffra]
MKDGLRRFIRECDICQRHKVKLRKPSRSENFNKEIGFMSNFSHTNNQPLLLGVLRKLVARFYDPFKVLDMGK